MPHLTPGDPFPQLSVSLVDGRTLALPGDLEGEYSILLFYRAWW